MTQRTLDKVQIAMGKLAESLGLCRHTNTSWREITEEGIRCVFLQRSQWHDPVYYYPTLAFYPIQFLQIGNLPRKRPLPEDYPVQIRFENICGSKKYRENFEKYFNLAGDLSCIEHLDGIKALYSEHLKPYFDALQSIEGIMRLAQEGKLPAGTLRMPVLGLVDPSMESQARKYDFQNGEFVPIE